MKALDQSVQTQLKNLERTGRTLDERRGEERLTQSAMPETVCYDWPGDKHTSRSGLEPEEHCRHQPAS